MVNVCVMYYSKILKVTRIILFFGLSSSVNLAEEDNIVISYIVNYEEIYRLEEKIYELSQKILDCLLYTSPSPRDQRGSRMACCA